ncbi:methyltransferase domain-containing protein [Pendulispora rubella]|uniref:Methyltransferase domain-containing protein n=1 Tax=Pendulispora rubella TaxID=2741070 RepID=A0ABZ2KXK9_9BACT
MSMRIYSTGSLTRGVLSPLDQVRLFERKYDPGSIAILQTLPLRREWRCLDIGAGAGSMSRWLAERVVQGNVVAVDLDTQHLAAAPNVTVQRADITQAAFEHASFDLVFARAAFGHLREPETTLRRAWNWLRPGGWMVVEDSYHLPPEHAPTEAGRILLAAYLRVLAEQGADLAWGRKLPRALARIGCIDVDARITPAGPGQSPADDDLIGLRLRQEGHRIVESGLVTSEQLAEFLAHLGSPLGRDLSVLMVSAWGRHS